MSEIIVALDVDNVADAKELVQSIGMAVDFYKVGMELAYSPGGFAFVDGLKGMGMRVFLDLKLHDIGTTVEKATRSLMRLYPDILTVHAFPQTMKAAVEGRGASNTLIYGVTILTSYSQEDALEAGYHAPIGDLVMAGASRAIAAGVDGIVCSAKEAGYVRQTWPKLGIITPGIRLPSSSSDDQKRIVTPQDAVKAGANYLVVGRPITQAADPYAAAQSFQEALRIPNSGTG